MTRGKALETMLGRYRVAAKMVDCDYDPAGDTTTYIPDPRSVEVIQAFVDRPLTESDFWFVVGCGPTPSHYSVRAEVIAEATAKYDA